MDVYNALAYIVLGGILGVVGQGARVIVGIKKMSEESYYIEDNISKKLEKINKNFDEIKKGLSNILNKPEPQEKETLKIILDIIYSHEKIENTKNEILKENEIYSRFSWTRLILSLLIAFTVGGIAGVLGVIYLYPTNVDKEFMITILGFGYAGTDFIEGAFLRFLKRKI